MFIFSFYVIYRREQHVGLNPGSKYKRRFKPNNKNNNEYHNGESSDDTLDTLDRAVTLLWKNNNGNGSRRRTPMATSNLFPCRK